MPNNPPYRYVTRWTLDGSAMTGEEASGTWTGTGSIDGESWKTDLVFGNGMTVAGTYSAGDKLVVTSESTMGGNVISSLSYELPLLDEAACHEQFSKIALPAAGF